MAWMDMSLQASSLSLSSPTLALGGLFCFT